MAIWNADEWNFRMSESRSILVKSEEKNKRRIYAEDTSTRMPFTLELAEDVPADSVEIGTTYEARLKVYTAKSVEDVKADFIELFQVLDVDRPMEDFLGAACCYPDFVKFELAEVEE